MQKNSYRYEQTAARLVVEGYPDLSASQAADAIGILSSWKLQLVGAPEVEGTRDHLESMMSVVMPYARYRLSGVGRSFGGESRFVCIQPVASENRHQLELRSSREGVQPLQLTIDDAELADLVRCLDRLRLDERIRLNWSFPADRPLTRQEISDRIPILRRIGAPVLGGLALAASLAIALIIPLPPGADETTAASESTPDLPSQEPER